MIKFWKIGARKEVQKLEKIFIKLSELIDKDLLGLYYYTNSLTDSVLFNEEEKIHELKESMRFYEKEHRACFCFFYNPHPNYEKFKARADLILSMINKEFSRRGIEGFY